MHYAAFMNPKIYFTHYRVHITKTWQLCIVWLHQYYSTNNNTKEVKVTAEQSKTGRTEYTYKNTNYQLYIIFSAELLAKKSNL
jgi:hypothetical protein